MTKLTTKASVILYTQKNLERNIEFGTKGK